MSFILLKKLLEQFLNAINTFEKAILYFLDSKCIGIQFLRVRNKINSNIRQGRDPTQTQTPFMFIAQTFQAPMYTSEGNTLHSSTRSLYTISFVGMYCVCFAGWKHLFKGRTNTSYLSK